MGNVELGGTIHISLSKIQSKYVGYWLIGDYRFDVMNRPGWFQRLMARATLGWKWVDGQ